MCFGLMPHYWNCGCIVCWHLRHHLVVLLAPVAPQIPEKNASINTSCLARNTSLCKQEHTCTYSDLSPFLLALLQDQQGQACPFPPEKVHKETMAFDILNYPLALFTHSARYLTLCPLFPGRPGKPSKPLSPYGKGDRLACFLRGQNCL